MPLTGNPLRDIYDAVWSMLEDATQSDWGDKVNSNNRVKFSADAEDILTWEVESVPEVAEAAVVIADLKPADRPASSSQLLVVQWEVWIRRGRSAHATFLDIQWETYKALLNWEEKLKDVLVDNTNYYLRNCDTRSVQQSILTGRSVKGWRAVWVGDCACWFRHSDLVS